MAGTGDREVREGLCCDEHQVPDGSVDYCLAHVKLILHCLLTHQNLNKNLKKNLFGREKLFSQNL